MGPRTIGLALAISAAMLLAPRTAMGQLGQYMGRSDNPVGPTVSPYLNLLQQGNFGVTNYQSLVQPLVNQGRAIDRQGNSINRLQQQVSRPAAPARGGARSTGHASFFMNYSHYYPSMAR